MATKKTRMVLYKANINGTDMERTPTDCLPLPDDVQRTAVALLGRGTSGIVQSMFLANVGAETGLFYGRSFNQSLQTSAAPSRCIHAELVAADPVIFEDKYIDTLLGFCFAGETDICANQLPRTTPVDAVPDVKLDAGVVETILGACFSRWKVASLPVTVILHDEQYVYETVLGIYKSILKSMPYLMRARFGYCIHPPRNIQIPENICVCFLPMSLADECPGNAVYAMNPEVHRFAVNNMSDDLRDMCSFLATASQKERESLFRWLAAFVEYGTDGMWRWQNSRPVPEEYAQIYTFWKSRHSTEPYEDNQRIEDARSEELGRIQKRLNDLPLNSGNRTVGPAAIEEIFTSEAFLLRNARVSAQLKTKMLRDWFTNTCKNDKADNFGRLDEIQSYYEAQGNEVQKELQTIWKQYLLSYVDYDVQNCFSAYDKVIALKKHLLDEPDYAAYEAMYRYYLEVQQSPTVWYRHIHTALESDSFISTYEPNVDWCYLQALQELRAFLDDHNWDVNEAFVWKVFKALRSIRGNPEPEENKVPPNELDTAGKQKKTMRPLLSTDKQNRRKNAK